MSSNPISSLPQQNAPIQQSQQQQQQPTIAKRRSSAGGQVAGNRGDNHTPTPTATQQPGHQEHHHYSSKHQQASQKAMARPHTANLVSRSARNSNPNLNNRAQSTTSTDVYENTERTQTTANTTNGNYHQVRGHSSESVTRKDYSKGSFNHRTSLSTTAQKPPNFFSSKKSSLQRST